MELHVPSHTRGAAHMNGAPQNEHPGMRATSRQDGQPLADISNSSRIGTAMPSVLTQPVSCTVMGFRHFDNNLARVW